MKRAGIFCAVILIIFAAFSTADDERAKPSAAPMIGFDESFGVYAGNTLDGNFSKLKAALESEFGATVEANSNGWGNLSKYDIYIVPAHYTVEPLPLGDMQNLNDYVRQGGCLIVLWSHTDPRNWSLHDNVLEPFARLNIKLVFPNSFDMVVFREGFQNTPNPVSLVRSGSSAWLHSATGNAEFIAYNSQSQAIAGFNEDLGPGKGKVFLIASFTAFRNDYIDLADNKKFLFNIIAKCTGSDGGGGGGGGGGGLIIKKVKGKPKVLAPGNNMTLVIVVRNTSSAATAATTAQFYLSTNTSIDGTDVFLGSVAIDIVNPGKKQKAKVKVLVPNVPENFYYVVGKVVSTSEEKESKKQVEVR